MVEPGVKHGSLCLLSRGGGVMGTVLEALAGRVEGERGGYGCRWV